MRAEFSQQAQQNALTQPTIQQSVELSQPWPINHRRAALITRRITEMIALDLQPFSMVEDVGFLRLIHTVAPQYVMPSRKYFSDTKIPELYSEVRETLQQVISEQSSLVFTVDIWTCQYTIQSYLGLTCHWLTNDFQRKMAVLLCQPFDGSHTALNIADAWKNMMKDWQLTNANSPKCHVVVSDSAANMLKTFRELSINRIACFAHSLQLVVKDGLLSQRTIIDACAVVRAVVGHFKHSSSALSAFHAKQRELNIPQHALLQDVATRWSSTHTMLQRILDQRRALTLYVTEEDDCNITLPSANQWQLIEKTTLLLNQFADLTKQVCRDDACVSHVIPAVAALTRFLQLPETAVEVTGLNTMRTELIKVLRKRFAGLHTNMIYAIATAVDPRYKLKYFTNQERSKVTAELLQLLPKPAASTSTHSDNVSNDSTTDNEPAAKKICGYQDCFELAAIDGVDQENTVDDDDEGSGDAVAGTGM